MRKESVRDSISHMNIYAAVVAVVIRIMTIAQLQLDNFPFYIIILDRISALGKSFVNI